MSPAVLPKSTLKIIEGYAFVPYKYFVLLLRNIDDLLVEKYKLLKVI